MRVERSADQGAPPGVATARHTQGEAGGPDPDVKANTGGGAALIVFAGTLFLSALLLFSVQPMFAKMVLPILGGSPSVWAVAMVFFQATLLAGYCYAHILIRRARPLTGGVIHLALTAIAILALPIAVPTGLGEPPAGDPALWQLGVFALGVGLPFLAISANAPLLQAWFAASGHPHARDPYFLYGASNLGSLMALLAYPLVLEPAFGLAALSWLWAAGFVLLLACLAVSALLVWRGDTSSAAAATVARTETASSDDAAPDASSDLDHPSRTARPSLARRLGWIGLAFVPSALLTAFTTHITMDVASAPLLWVLPLALYLLTFVLVFRDRPIALVPSAVLIGLGAIVFWNLFADKLAIPEVGELGQLIFGLATGTVFAAVVWWLSTLPSMAVLRAVHLGALAVAMIALSQTKVEGWFVTASTGVAVFFSATMVAHRTLFELRPAASRLTEFYLFMSLGGVLGGLFAALIAPRIFSQIFEYPILLALTVACRPGALKFGEGAKLRDRLLAIWLVVAGSILAIYWLPKLLLLAPSIETSGWPSAAWWLRGAIDAYMAARLFWFEWGVTLIIALGLGVALISLRRHATAQLAVAAAMCATVITLPSGVRRSDAERSYFGVYRVYASDEYNVLTHGTTLHGAQKMRDEFGDAAPDPTPGTYYHPASPMARAVKAARANAADKGGTGRYGIVGLGAGSLACLAAKGERWRFFEIDPLVVALASNPANFTYLESCQPKPADIVLGDARLTLAREPDGSFDVIVVDAFTSDAVPIHLMTAEALQLMLRKVSPNGLLVLHISNRYLDLDGVLGATVPLVEGAHGLLISDNDSDGSYATSTSTIAVLARNAAALESLKTQKDVSALEAAGLRGWTDDFSDIIGPFLSKLNK